MPKAQARDPYKCNAVLKIQAQSQSKPNFTFWSGRVQVQVQVQVWPSLSCTCTNSAMSRVGSDWWFNYQKWTDRPPPHLIRSEMSTQTQT